MSKQIGQSEFEIRAASVTSIAANQGTLNPEGLAFLYAAERIEELEAERDALRERNQKAESLLRRYRNETPLGHQPHMIAHKVDKLLQEGGE